MAMSVTVQAGMSGQTVTVPTAAQNAILAQQIAYSISQGVANLISQPEFSDKGPPPVLPDGAAGTWFQDTPGLTVLPAAYTDVVVTEKASILGGGGQGEHILSGNNDLLFISPDGSGTVVAGTGRHEIALLGSNSGASTDWLVSAAGSDTILALGGGRDTIDAVGSRTVVVGGAAQITFIGGAGAATVLGGTGSDDSIVGGSGPLVARGGNGANNGGISDNVLIGGTGKATLFGGGAGDRLFAQGNMAQDLVAGTGDETLTGSLSTGKDLFTFIKGNAGTDTVVDFTRGVDHIHLSGFTSAQENQAIATQQNTPGGTVVTLSDHTQITFIDVTKITRSDFS